MIGKLGRFSKGVRRIEITDDERQVFANIDCCGSKSARRAATAFIALGQDMSGNSGRNVLDRARASRSFIV